MVAHNEKILTPSKQIRALTSCWLRSFIVSKKSFPYWNKFIPKCTCDLGIRREVQILTAFELTYFILTKESDRKIYLSQNKGWWQTRISSSSLICMFQHIPDQLQENQGFSNEVLKYAI